MFWLKCLVLFVVISFCCAEFEPIHFKQCPGTEDFCTINTVNVDPCREAAQHAACRFKRRRPAKINFEYTPKFDADTLEARLVWVKSETEEAPLVSLDKEACKYTTCPVENGVTRNYAIDIPMEDKFPLRPYNIRWSLTSPAGEACCFSFDIKLVR